MAAGNSTSRLAGNLFKPDFDRETLLPGINRTRARLAELTSKVIAFILAFPVSKLMTR
jgi:hypothetical protein